jgi:ribosomal protein S18 acetylase RimI-like enzyme
MHGYEKYRVPGRRNMNLQFEPAGQADADALLHMARAFHLEDGHTLDAAGEMAVLQIAKGEPFARAWIAWLAGEAIGYVVVTLGYSIEYGGRDGFIDDLYLVPAVRGRGYGRQLLRFALSQAAALGIRTLHLEVETANENATRLYRSSGFAPTGRTLMRCRLDPAGGTP